MEGKYVMAEDFKLIVNFQMRYWFDGHGGTRTKDEDISTDLL